MPGTSARLFDVKRAIVKAKRLDRTGNTGPQLEFDLSVRNVNTDEEYLDEGMLLPRGTRVVVQRLPAARGHGLLARIARAESGMAGLSSAPQSFGNQAAAQSGFYTISSRQAEEEDEFVDSKSAQEVDEEKELAALRAVTDQAGAMGSSGSSHANKVWTAGKGTTGSNSIGGVPHPTAHRSHHHFHKPQHHRPNADPELREAERREAAQAQPKKRATGIPRTFLTLSAPPPTNTADVSVDSNDIVTDSLTATLQPNAIGFEALIARGGGQSGSGPGSKKRDLDYALKVTATTIPEHLQCGICEGVVKNAMLIPWDPEGRTACETCIRDGLTQNAFRCPLTGQDGVSPDDLLPNMGLRKAAELFIAGVMEKMDEIEQAKEAEEEEERHRAENDSTSVSKSHSMGFEGDSADKGVVLSKRTARQQVKQHGQNDDIFGGDDEFGGDVFDVGNQSNDDDDMFGGEDETDQNNVKQSTEHLKAENFGVKATKTIDSARNLDNPSKGENRNGIGAEKGDFKIKADNESKMSTSGCLSLSGKGKDSTEYDRSSPKKAKQGTGSIQSPANALSSGTSRAELIKKRCPPAGYAMGPAGGATVRASASPITGRTGGVHASITAQKAASAVLPGRGSGGPGGPPGGPPGVRGGFPLHPPGVGPGGRGGWGRGGGPLMGGGGGGGPPGGHTFYPGQVGGPTGGGHPLRGGPDGHLPPGTGYPRGVGGPPGGWGGGGLPPPGGLPPGAFLGRGGYPARGGFAGRGGRGWEGEHHSRVAGASQYPGEGVSLCEGYLEITQPCALSALPVLTDHFKVL